MTSSRILTASALVVVCLMGSAANQRTRVNFDDNWTFALGDASSPAKDFGNATEYFNYYTKANSIHNEGPYSPKFDPSKWGKEWVAVDLPHDWVVDLPYAPEASHSHGYKTVGHKYPESSVGWYRKTFTVPAEDLGKHISLQFDGIFRDAKVWVNGFYLGHEPSGYADQIYDISEYLNYGGDNLVCVRADATFEEGWFYEGAGIYRHVWLDTTAPVHVDDHGTYITSALNEDYDKGILTVETTVANDGNAPGAYSLKHTLLDKAGNAIATADVLGTNLLAKQRGVTCVQIPVSNPTLWTLDNPYMYSVQTDVLADGQVIDTYTTPIGIRQIEFDPNRGFILNGQQVKLKGVNMHQDHAGVGAAIPDELHVYRLKELKKMGVNAYRSSHNPASPAVLDICDTLGILVIDENRLTGVNDEHIRLLGRMIKRDRNHPSVILYSVGNEEWGIEWDIKGERIAESMREYVHRLDPTRPMTAASSSGPNILVPTDVAGYNYIMQNPVDQHRRDYPQRCAIGSEETSGCGTRGIYYDDYEHGRMMALNRKPNGSDSILNAIERGWKFYDERPWLGGLFYWTGFDYRGEPNPLSFPATGSSFGILDYCGFPKDEAWYLRSWWTDEPTLHLLPHWTLRGHEGEEVDVWAYSNMDEVELYVNGKSVGRKPIPKDGHQSWTVTYKPGELKAVGYKNGKKQMTERIVTAGEPVKANYTSQRIGKLTVVNVDITDRKNHPVPDACIPVTITVGDGTRIIGSGNGDSAWQNAERPTDPTANEWTIPTFNGRAQFLLWSDDEPAVSVNI